MTISPSDQLDTDRLAESRAIARVETYETLSSTQDRAHEVARSGAVGPLPLLIVAEEQTAGRGRGANRWWTGRGSLAFSLLFDPAGWQLSRQPLPERSLAVGVAIVETVRPLLAGYAVGLHWPNDVFVSGKKLAGILIDVLPSGQHIVGIGLNVNNTLHGAPGDVRARAVSLCELSGRTFDRTTLLLELLRNLEAAVRESAAAPEEFGSRFQDLCLQIGQELTIEVGGQCSVGRCAGIAADGALLLETLRGREKFYSGVLR
ncbi:MAG: biotin--[acetyl-CoA-carboxylase] ligase [Planctomycetia bacterium]|nr:biotin--[acetyl-CoA-carboxylase] ligase [Planctomycetia bacterium]